jgi:hypothetical protein
MLTSRFWTFLAIFWVIRGTDLLITGIGHGYIWLKHGFPINNLSVIGEVHYADWVKLICFIIGVVILIQQRRHKKAQANHSLTEAA